MELTGKGVFLTGAAFGIGRAVLEALLERGARVLFCDIQDKGKEVRDELAQKFSENDVIFVQCDVGDADQLKEAFDKAVSEFGAVEICINNAAISSEKDWERMIFVNQFSVIRGSLMAFEHMRKDKGGKGGVIINTASMNSIFYGQFTFPVYLATKQAVLGFTTCWANNPDQPDHGVRWTAVCPDHVVYTNIGADKSEGRHIKANRPVVKPPGYTVLPFDHRLWAADMVPAYMTCLDDADSNGYVILTEIEREQESLPIRHRVMVMDKSIMPVRHLVEKKAIILPRSQPL